jgi:hypothetical protein
MRHPTIGRDHGRDHGRVLDRVLDHGHDLRGLVRTSRSPR